jgi:hypothetical protein
MLRQYTATITTDGSGDAVVYLEATACITGRIVAIKYVPTSIATGATLVFTGNTSGVAIMTKANAGTSTVWYYPRAIPNKVADGSAFTNESVPIWLFQEIVKLVVSSGGATKTGTVTLWVDEPVNPG